MLSTKFYLDARRSVSPEDPAPLKFAIYVDGVTAYVNTGIKIAPLDWDDTAQASLDLSSRDRVIIFRLRIDKTIADMQDRGELDGLTAFEMKDAIIQRLQPAQVPKKRFMACFELVAESRDKERTKEIYRATMSRIRAFDKNADRLDFSRITVEWLDRFDAFLAKTSPNVNARNIHMRNIRAVFNYARKRSYTMHYPFINYQLHYKKTAKRALTVTQLRKLLFAELPENLQRFRDFFALSFMLIGMNTEDLIHAKAGAEDRLEYRRAKTDTPYSIKIEEECASLINRYKGKKYLLNVLDTYASTHVWTSKVDTKLKDIAQMLELPPISMYWARHTWLTIGAELEIPKETLAAAAGHSGGTVTDIYIKFDRAKIDRANRQVLDYVLKDKRPMTAIDLLNDNIERLRAQLSNIG